MPAPKPKPRILKPKRGMIKGKVSINKSQVNNAISKGMMKRMTKTKKGRLLDPKVVRKTSSKGVVSLEKVQGENTRRAIKNKLKSVDKYTINSMVKSAKNKYSQKRALLEQGIDARQLRAKGYKVKETLNIFGLEDTTRVYGNKRVASEYGGLGKTVTIFGINEVARSFGGLKNIVAEFGLESAYRAFGMTLVNKAHGGARNIMKLYGAEEVHRAAQAAFAGIKNYDVLPDIREFRKHNGVVETAHFFGIKATGRALGLSTGEMKELARRLKQYKK